MRASLLSVALIAAGCDPEVPEAPVDAGLVRLDDSGVDAGPPGCGAFESPVQHDCLERFRRDDGACAVHADDCNAAEVPSRSEGCVPTGAACAERHPDGRCVRPSAPPGMRPTLADGPQRVGPTACVDAFLVDGVCRIPPDACPASSFTVPASGCVDLDALCDAPRPDGTHIDLNAQPGGDGSAQRPFATLQEALAAEAPSPYLLGAGTHRLPALTTDMEIIGVCPAQTSVRPADQAADEPIAVQSRRDAHVRVSRVSLSGVSGIGSQFAGVCAQASSGVLTITDSHFARCDVGARATLTGRMVVRGSLFEDARPRPVRRAIAIQAQGGGEIDVYDSAAREVDAAVQVDGGRAGVHGVALLDLRRPNGVYTLAGAIEVDQSVIARATRHAVTASGPTASITLRDVAVVDTQTDGRRDQADVALDVRRGGALLAEDTILAFNATADARVTGDDSQLTLRRTVSTRSTLAPVPFGSDSGVGVVVSGGVAVLEDVAITHHLALGVTAPHRPMPRVGVATLALSGVVTGNGIGMSTNPGSRGGVLTQRLSGVFVHDALFADNAEYDLGIVSSPTTTIERTTFLDGSALTAAFGDLARLTLDAVDVDTSSNALSIDAQSASLTRVRVQAGADCADLSFPMVVSGGTHTWTQVALHDGCGAGLLLAGGASLSATDCLIAGTQPIGDDELGFGALVGGRSAATFDGLSAHGIAGVGMNIDEASTGTLQRSTLFGMRGAADGKYGYGVYASRGTDLTLNDTLIEDTRVAGVLAFGAVLHTERLVVSGTVAGRYLARDGETYDGGGDGVYLFESEADCADLRITNSAGVGLVAEDTQGEIRDLHVYEAPYGLQTTADVKPALPGYRYCGDGIALQEGWAPENPGSALSELPPSDLPDPPGIPTP